VSLETIENINLNANFFYL